MNGGTANLCPSSSRNIFRILGLGSQTHAILFKPVLIVLSSLCTHTVLTGYTG